jgi:NADPH:quinone reductase-like Zn-dependent oxidoreductase
MRTLVPTGKPSPLVDFADVDEPAGGEGRVVVAVEAFGVNRGEVYLLRSPRAGWRPGQDVAGTVVATTDGGPAVGTRVVALADWEGWAERVAVPVGAVTPLPDAVSTTQAAALPLAGITALRLVRAAGPLIGTRVLLTGASGGVGHLLAQLLAGAGAEVVAVTASDERGAGLLKLGASATVRSVEDAGGGFDVVLESVGGETLTASLTKAVRPGGLVLWYGQASLTPPTLDLFGLLWPAHDARLVPFNYYLAAGARDDDLATIVRLVAEGRLVVPVGREADWSATAEVLRDLEERRITGKAVLRVTEGRVA